MCEIAGRVDVTIARADGDTIARADGGVVSQVLEQMEASFAGVSSSSSPPITWVVGVAGAESVYVWSKADLSVLCAFPALLLLRRLLLRCTHFRFSSNSSHVCFA